MESKSRRQTVLLAVLLVVLAAALWWNYGGTETAAPAHPGAQGAKPAQSPRAAAGGSAQPGATDGLALDRLKAPRPDVEFGGRDPFRFRPAPPPAPPPSAAPPNASAGGPGGVEPAVPAGPVVPPIPLKFIGTLERTAQRDRFAVLSDGRGNTFYGREGDIIEGRYRIVRIGVESIEMAYVDGQGQQTIRLSGS